MVPQFLKEKDCSFDYKFMTAAVFFAGFLPEYVSIIILIILFPLFLHYNHKKNEKLYFGRTGRMFSVFAGFVLLSFVWSQNMFYSVSSGIIWAFGLLAFLLASNLSDTREKIENLILGMIGSAAVNSAVSILQMIFMAAGKSKYFPSPLYRTLDKWVYSLFSVDMFFEETPDRVSGCFDSPLVLATFFVMIFPLAAFCCFYATTKKRRIFSVVTCVLIFFGIMFTFLRGAVIAVIASFMLLAFTGKKPAKIMSGVAFASAVVWMIVIFERRGVSSSQDISTMDRFALWEACLSSVSGKYLLGLGAGSGNVSDLLISNGIFYSNAHSLYVEMLAEIGIVGILVFAAFIAVAVADIALIFKCGGWWKRFAVALLSTLVGLFAMSVFDHTLWTPKEIIYFAVILGFISAAKRAAQKSGKLNDEKSDKKIKSKQVDYEREA